MCSRPSVCFAAQESYRHELRAMAAFGQKAEIESVYPINSTATLPGFLADKIARRDWI